MDFPYFDGNNPRSWIRKCERYFSIFSIPEMQKVELATMYVNGKADVWLQGYMMQKPSFNWNELKEAVCKRFGDIQGSEIVEEFNKLDQKGSIEDYTEKFEELRAGMLSINPHLPESYFVSSFVSGLKGEIKSLVKLGRPGSLMMVYEQARLHSETVQAIVKLSKPPWKPGITSLSYKNVPRVNVGEGMNK